MAWASGISGWCGAQGLVGANRRPARARCPPGRRSAGSRPRARSRRPRRRGGRPRSRWPRRADPRHDAVHHAPAGAAARCARVLEEGQLGARRALLVGVEEVVDARIVLVDGLRGEPQAEHPRVEVQVPRRVARDGADVVDPLEPHGDRPLRCIFAYATIRHVLAHATTSAAPVAPRPAGPHRGTRGPSRYPARMDRAALTSLLAEWGQPAYRARQAIEAQRSGADGWGEVSTLPAALRARLEESLPFWALTPDARVDVARRHREVGPARRRRRRGRGRADRPRRGPAHGLRVEPGRAAPSGAASAPPARWAPGAT